MTEIPPPKLPGTGIRSRVLELPDSLFAAPGERWGWRYHLPMGPALPPVRVEPAVAAFPEPTWADAAGRGELSARAGAAQWRQWVAACRETMAEHQRRRAESEKAAFSARIAREALLTVAKAFSYSVGTPDSPVTWSALRPVTAGRVDVYGGIADGWSNLLITLVTSLIGSGTRVIILDLSRQRVAYPLVKLAMVHFLAADQDMGWWQLPGDGRMLDLFAGLGPAQVADCLADALHAGSREARAERDLDADVLERVCEPLAPTLTMTRISAGLRVLSHEEPRGGQGSPLTDDEFDRLSDAFGTAGHHEDRIRTLQARLRRMSHWGSDERRPLLDTNDQLSVVEVAVPTREAAAGLLGPLLLQVLGHHIGQDAPATPGIDAERQTAVIVAGADLLPAEQVEWVDRIADSAGVRLICMFGHLHGDAQRLLGRGGPVVLMRMGNTVEAETACNFIGRSHRFVLHQFTKTASVGTTESTTRTDGHTSEHSIALGIGWSATDAKGSANTMSRADASGTSTSSSESTAMQRVYELLVEPHELQTLPETAFFLVDPDDRKGPRARLGDCNPWLINTPGLRDRPWRELI